MIVFLALNNFVYNNGKCISNAPNPSMLHVWGSECYTWKITTIMYYISLYPSLSPTSTHMQVYRHTTLQSLASLPSPSYPAPIITSLPVKTSANTRYKHNTTCSFSLSEYASHVMSSIQLKKTLIIDVHLYSAILHSLEQTHCAHMWFYMSD